MTSSTVKFPFYAKITLVIIGLYLFVDILILTKNILIPVFYAAFIAGLMSPVIDYLERKKMNRVVSILLIVFFTSFIFFGLMLLIFSQLTHLSDAWPDLKFKFQELLKQMVVWSSDYFNVSTDKINLWIKDLKNDLIERNSGIIGNTLYTTGTVLVTFSLTMVYVFMLLFYQKHIIKFIHKLFGYGNNEKVDDVLDETKRIIQLYIVGLFTEIAIIAILNSLGLFFLGIDYAILLGVSAAMLNLIPYLGGLITMSIFMMIVLLTKTPIDVLYVLILYSGIQFIDNNIVIPRIVGSKVSLNAFVSVIVVIVGAAIWGIAGMFLVIPIAAIIKVILDQIEPLKPWGFLMGHSASDMNK